MQFPSKLIEDAVNEISRLPGIGKKTALRLVLHILKSEKQEALNLADSLVNLRTHIQYCQICKNISDGAVCNICSSPRRDKSIICIVEDIRDVLAIENTAQYVGLYHILGGIISPIEGVGPHDLHIESLVERIGAPESEVKEVILALSPTMEGDTTAFYITKKLKSFKINITSIARGISVGGELEYTDEITLGRSILSRIKYDVE